MTSATRLAQRSVALMAWAAAFVACEGVSRHPSVEGTTPSSGGSGAAGTARGDGSVGASGSSGSGGSAASGGNSGASVGTAGNSGSGNAGGGSGDASQGSGGSAGADSGGTAGADSGGAAGADSGGTADADSGGTADADSGGTAGADSGGTAGAGNGGTEGLDGSADDSGVVDGGDGGPCAPGCPPSAPVCSAGACRKIQQIAPGGSGHLCVLVDDGTVRCWGLNDKYQLGDGTKVPRTTPGPAISGLSDVVQLGPGFEHTCAVTVNGSVWCWGHNFHGQLGFSGETTVPVEVPNLGGPAHEVSCHGQAAYLTGLTCALMRSGQVKCWGSNFHGELGNGTRDATPTPTDVLNLTDAAQITVGPFAACALRRTGKVVCWGYNGGDGRLATGSTETFVTAPEEVLGLSGVAMIDSGENYFCAVAGAERRVRCWGEDLDGRLGDGPAHDGGVSSAVVDTPAAPVVEVQTGGRSACARMVSGDVLCWGANWYGHQGNGNRNGSSILTTRTLLLDKATSIAFRWGYGCAILENGRMQCWGNNPYIGTPSDGWATPEYVAW